MFDFISIVFAEELVFKMVTGSKSNRNGREFIGFLKLTN